MSDSSATRHRSALVLAAVALAAGGAVSAADKPAALAPPAPKPRVVVMTDIGGDPDDQQSMVRFLLYACDVEVEGLLTGLGHGHSKNTRPDLIRKAVEAYGQVLGTLREHRKDYPSKDELLGRIKKGRDSGMHEVGKGMDSEASDWIIRVVDRPDPRAVWFTIWGGPRELAQALWKVQHTRGAARLADFRRKVRVHSIADQDRTTAWVKQHHPDVFWISSLGLFRGIWASGEQALVSPEWLRKHVRSGHGPLGAVYPARAAGKTGVKEGDTPSFFYVLPNGLSDPEHPEWGNWGGRFRPSGRGREYLPAADRRGGRDGLYYTIHRWRRAYQNAFEARMDWCVKAYKEANHEPVAACNGDRGRGVLTIAAEAGTEARLSAAGSSDPDGDALSQRWWVYREAGTYRGDVPLRGATARDAAITVPPDAAGRSIHVILEVTDAGRPPLTAYRRAVVTVSGQPAEQTPDAGKPITSLPGPPRETGAWTFYRGINLNGPPIEIDGRKWDPDRSANFVCKDRAVNSPQVRLRPPTDAARAKMIHSFRWNRRARIALTGVPAGTYAVYVYVWEDNNPETFTLSLNGRVVARDSYSGAAGCWQRLGPWITSPANGAITLRSRGGAANFSGVEVWRGAAGAARK